MSWVYNEVSKVLSFLLCSQFHGITYLEEDQKISLIKRLTKRLKYKK